MRTKKFTKLQIMSAFNAVLSDISVLQLVLRTGKYRREYFTRKVFEELNENYNKCSLKALEISAPQTKWLTSLRKKDKQLSGAKAG